MIDQRDAKIYKEGGALAKDTSWKVVGLIPGACKRFFSQNLLEGEIVPTCCTTFVHFINVSGTTGD